MRVTHTDDASGHGFAIQGWTAGPPPAQGFCTACGSPPGVAGCPACGLSGVDRPAEGPARTGVPRAITIAASAVLTMLVAASLVLTGSSRRELDTVERRLADAQDARDRDAATISALNDRLHLAEARVALTADAVSLASAASPSVFTVQVAGALGSAFVVTSDASSAQLVTNFHVVESEWLVNRTAVTIRQDTGTSFPGTITAADAGADLALVKVDRPLPVLRIDRNEPAVGSPVVVVGSPLGLDGTVTDGIVSALRTDKGVRRVQISAPISPGNSGGPVLDRNGAVIGVSVSKDVADGAEGLGFAVPAAQVCDVLHVC